MNKYLFLALAVVFAVSASYGLYLNPPRYYEADGTTMWKKQMVLTKKEHPIFYTTTKYNIMWNGISAEVNGKKVAEKRWVEFVLWNGLGIRHIEVFGVDTNTDLSPTPKDPTIDTAFGAIGLDFPPELNGRYCILGILPPKKESRLKIRVTDQYGNVTEDTVPVSSIKL